MPRYRIIYRLHTVEASSPSHARNKALVLLKAKPELITVTRALPPLWQMILLGRGLPSLTQMFLFGAQSRRRRRR